MKKLQLLLLILLIPFLGYTQNSWIQIQLLTDNYPEETSWTITPPGGSPIIAQSDSVMVDLTLYDTVIPVGGDIIVNLYDSFGDGLGGWNGSPEGWFMISNSCQDTIMYVVGDFGSLYTDTLIIAPCAPPSSGCTDPIAINFDSLAITDDGSCQYINGCTDPIATNYDPIATQDDNSCQYIQGCMNPNASNYDSTAAELPNGIITPGATCNLVMFDNTHFGVDTADYFADPSLWQIGTRIYVGAAQTQWFVDVVVVESQYSCNAGLALVYVVATEAEADGIYNTNTPNTNVNAIVGEPWFLDPCVFVYGCTQPNALNYNPLAGVDDGSCINIPGCTDLNSANYNPAATLDDGSCGGGGPITCSPGKELVTLEIMLDQYAGETGWNIYTTAGVLIDEMPAGSYAGQPMGAIVKKYMCIDYGTQIQFQLTDTYGDGLGGAQFGGIDGMWILYTSCDTLSQGIGDFGQIYTEVVDVNECDQNPINGCTDPNYVEYNPLATNDDGSCITQNIFGCIDVNAFNYDSNATAQLQNPGCNNTLRLTDWADNGWAGSFLVVTQGNNWWGPFTLGPNDLILDTLIYLNTTDEIKTYFYSFNQSQQTSNQCMFQIINPVGMVISEGGTNSFTDPLLSYNQFGQIYDDIALCGDNCIPKVYGCTDPLAVNYISQANTTDNSCYYNPGCMDAAYLEYHTQGFTADYDDGSCITYAIFGCMDQTMFNYDQYATVQWTSVVDQTDPCIIKVFGCLDPTAFNFNPLANTEDYSCIPVIYGCMDMTMFNYDPTANTDNSSCEPYVYGCTNSSALNYDPLANTDDGNCISYLYGCTDINALNYNPLANTDDGSCIDYLYGCTDSTATNYNNLANTDDGSCVPFIYGCTDVTAFNYDLLANTDDGSCIPYVYGCMDPTMWNYDVTANVDDGSCASFVYGCTDPTAWNYNSLANTNVGCIPFYYGCTDPTMFNYDANANTDDGSCVSIVIGCMDPNALNYDPLANTDNFSCILPLYGCTDPTMFNYNPLANVDDGTCIPIVLGCMDPAAFNYDPLANTNFGCNQVFLGCTDVTAFNYNYLANVDDGSCIPVILGCIDVNALNFDPTANTNTGCIYPIYGCTDPTMFNYDPLANVDDGNCEPVAIGCTDQTALNFDPLANTNNGCIYPIYGCTDPTMFNYDPNANVDDNSCVPIILGCLDINAINFDPLANTNVGCIYPILGCTDPIMFNYDPLANVDDGSCVPVIIGCMDPTQFNFDPTANTPSGNCIPYVFGCMDQTMFNYDPLANTDNGSCIPFAYGCTDIAAFNYNPSANTLDNSCCYIDGCTDPTALNYDANACFDDGSCIVIITGCTDVAAFNYDPTANVSDSTACLYDAGCYGGPGVPYWLNDNCYAWVIDVDNSCCTDDWDSYCVNLYDYCQQGMPTDINDILRDNDFAIYPNPTKNIVNLAYKQNAKIDLYGPLGELITSGENIKQIDLSAYSNGIYVLYVTYNNKTITHKIIKQ